MLIQQSQGPWNHMEGLSHLPNFKVYSAGLQVQTAGYLNSTHNPLRQARLRSHHLAFC